MHLYPRHLTTHRRRGSLGRIVVAFALAVIALATAVRGEASPRPATAPTTRPSVKHPVADAAAKFQAALSRGDSGAAMQATAQTPTPLADQPDRIKQLIAALKGDETPFAVHAVVAEGDIAVALVGEPAAVGDKSFDPDVWFFVCQAGEWKVLPDYRDYSREEYGFDAARTAAYEHLDERAQKRLLELKQEITGCAC